MAEIYKLKLHEKMDIEDGEVIRVPGGWIYRFFQLQTGNNTLFSNYTTNSVFVPYPKASLVMEG